MANVTGIAITIKAFLPTGKTLDEQFAALGIVKLAHETSDYTALLKAANIDEVKTENKVRRIEDKPALTIEGEVNKAESDLTGVDAYDQGARDDEQDRRLDLAGAKADEPADEVVPEFLKKKTKAA